MIKFRFCHRQKLLRYTEKNMNINEEKKERVILAGVHTSRPDALFDTTDESIAELSGLAETAGAEVVGIMVQNKPQLESGTYMGEGKLSELAEAAENMAADCVIFDDELSPVQLKNISDTLGVKVLDRSMLILDIFAMRAKSGKGKLQVELAQLKYRLPRLRGMGAVMSRTGAGIGTRGPGETKLETDRRHIHKRISALEGELKEIKKHRDLLRARRKKDNIITAALVGYTNAGKSSLLNMLTNAGVFAEDKLFATLDTTSRAITLEDNRTILLTDTVGFIRKLPHHLIEAFKSTLEEAVAADVLIHVTDISAPEYENHIRVVENVLSDIGAGGKPTIMLYNKADLAPDAIVPGDGIFISAKSGKGTEEFLKRLSDTAPGKKQKATFLIPYSMGDIVSRLHTDQKVLAEEFTPEGTLITILADKITYNSLRDYIAGGV